MKNNYPGFLLIFADKRKNLAFTYGESLVDVIIKNEPLLAIDLWEHAYFSDYGFDKKRYVKNLLPYINLDKINNFYKRDCKA